MENNKKISEGKKETILRELPWLAQYLEDVFDIKFKIIDLDLCRRPNEEFWILANYHKLEKIFVLDENGYNLITMGEKQFTPGPTWFSKNPKPRLVLNKNDTVEKSLKRLGGEANKSRFILSVSYVGRSYEFEGRIYYDDLRKVVTIYRTNNKLSIPVHLENQIQRHLSEIKKELEN